MSASSDLDERRLQFLRATSIGRISEVDFSDRTNNDDGGETHSDNQSESDAAGGGPLPALYENENEEVERARRPDNNSNTSYKPKALPASLGESRRNIFDTSTRVLRKGSSDNHHALVNTSSTTAKNANNEQQQQQQQQRAATSTSNDEILSIEEQMEMMNNEIANNRISTPDNLSDDDNDNGNNGPTTRDQYRNSYDYHGIGTIMYYIDVLKNSIDYERRKKLRMWYKTHVHPFRKIILSQVGCVLYILIVTFSYPPIGMKDPLTGNIIDTNSEVNTENGVILVNGDYRPVVAVGVSFSFGCGCVR